MINAVSRYILHIFSRQQVTNIKRMCKWIDSDSHKKKAVAKTATTFSNYSTKLFSFFALLGWRSFLRAFASICRIRSRVTSKS